MCYSSNKIRYVTVSDFDPIFELLKQLWTYKNLDKKEMREMFEINLNSSHITYICSIEEDLITGFCSLTVKNNLWLQAFLGNIDELVVDEKYRKKGIGKALMDEITKIARQKGCVQLELDSSFHREEAHKFYRNLGFESRALLFTKELI
jgi:ribosomal protein S18 acetylase RimI-like enzyme